MSAVGAVGVFYLATALMQRLLSNVRDVIENFKNMLKRWGGQEKVYLPVKRLALVLIERPKGITHFYVSISLSQKG